MDSLPVRISPDMTNALRTTLGPMLLTAFAMVAIFVAILAFNHGVFVYSIDDPYIHLAVGEQLRHLHYGINAGEASSPSLQATT